MHMAMDTMDDLHIGSWIGHAVSTSAVLTAIFGVLPPIATFLAAFAAFLWYVSQLYSSATVQRWLRRRRERRIEKLKKRLAIAEAWHTEVMQNDAREQFFKSSPPQ